MKGKNMCISLYDSIKALCDARGIKPGKMCVDLGLSKSLMTDLKSGRKKGITNRTAILIANYFDVSVDEVFGQEKIPAEGEDEIKEYLQILRERPETRMLLQYSKGVGKKEIEAMAEMMKKLRGDDA